MLVIVFEVITLIHGFVLVIMLGDKIALGIIKERGTRNQVSLCALVARSRMFPPSFVVMGPLGEVNGVWCLTKVLFNH
jgi:hypothetical protein